jgi:hypothetical protein
MKIKKKIVKKSNIQLSKLKMSDVSDSPAEYNFFVLYDNTKDCRLTIPDVEKLLKDYDPVHITNQTMKSENEESQWVRTNRYIVLMKTPEDVQNVFGDLEVDPDTNYPIHKLEYFYPSSSPYDNDESNQPSFFISVAKKTKDEVVALLNKISTYLDTEFTISERPDAKSRLKLFVKFTRYELENLKKMRLLLTSTILSDKSYLVVRWLKVVPQKSRAVKNETTQKISTYSENVRKSLSETLNEENGYKRQLSILQIVIKQQNDQIELLQRQLSNLRTMSS